MFSTNGRLKRLISLNRSHCITTLNFNTIRCTTTYIFFVIQCSNKSSRTDNS